MELKPFSWLLVSLPIMPFPKKKNNPAKIWRLKNIKKMKRTTNTFRRLCTLVAMLFLGSTALAQSPTLRISGVVADSVSQKPVEFATISILDSTGNIIKAGVSAANGGFSFTGLLLQSYRITLQASGLVARQIVIEKAADTTTEIRLGTIYLGVQSGSLKEVVVVANRPLVKQGLGQITYDIQADPESKASSLLDMMRKIPYLSVDGDGNILLKGNTSYRILLNGKPSSMMERNPKEVLRSIPASTIVRIEVITTPPAKYEAEGLAGIINIVTTKRVADGYNGSVNVYQRFPAGGPGIGTAFAFKEGRFTLSGYAGRSIFDIPLTDNTYARNTKGSNPTALSQLSTRESDSRSGYIGTEISWEIDSLNLISGQINTNSVKANNETIQRSLLNDIAGPKERYNLTNDFFNRGIGSDAALNFQHSFKRNRSRLLTFSYRHFNFKNDTRTDVSLSDKLNIALPDFQQRNNEYFGENTVQADYVHPIKNWVIEAGAKGIWRNNTSNFRYSAFNSATNAYELVPSFSNDYDYAQNVYAAYNNYQFAKNKWSMSVGLRFEKTVVEADFISTGTRVEQDYFNVIPSGAINYNLKNGGLNLGFSQRLRRPNIFRLNPYIDRSNPNVETSGNPNLRPVLLNDIQIGYSYSKKISLNIGFGYSFFNKLDLRVFSFDPVTNITRSTFENIGEGNRIGVDINIDYPLTQKLNLNINGNIAHFTLKGVVNQVPITNRWLTYFASPSLGYNFNKGWRAGTNMTIISQNPSSFQGTSNAFITSSFYVNKSLLNNKFTLSAAVNNPFTKFRDNITDIEGPDFDERRLTREYFRQISFSVNYRFGQLKGGVTRSKRSIFNDDVSSRKE
jgi:ferric enterobactin receptor